MLDQSDLSADVVVVGSGHNALICAAYLAKAGLEVAVLEAYSIVGGNTVTEELTFPGWRHDTCSSAHAVIQSNPVLRDDELGLIADYGLQYIHTDPATVFPLGDDDAVVVHRSLEATATEIARFSPTDAVRLTEVADDWNRTLKAEHRRWNMGLPPSETDAGRAYESLRSQSAWEVVHANFTHPVTRRILSWMGFATFQPPQRSGTGAVPISILNGRLEYGWATPVGGSGALPDRLAQLIRDHGGTVLTEAPVARILLEHGRAAGVLTADGRRVLATQAVVSSAHVRSLSALLDGHESPDLAAAAEAWRPGLALFAVHAALKHDVTYSYGRGASAPATAGALGSPEGILRQVQGCLATGEPELDDPFMLMVSSTAVDPERAPGGTFKILTAAPLALAGGRSWDDYGPEYADHLLGLAGRSLGGLEPENVLAVVPSTPTGLARRNPANLGGSCHGGEFELPDGVVVPGWPRHATDIPGLFLTGSMSHPGGSVSGWPGRNAAQAVLGALRLDAHAVMA
ncbi:MAG: NAD(P)/FAD-dependent oxidoreductase [Conexibacteraceae bacterium]|nr:NAD(P)/FAD-dependent oxidoreductase [Conexibacteraceae bacterium]